MPDTYRRRERKPQKKEPQPQPGLLKRLGQLLLKQTAAALICTAVVWGMHSMNIPQLQGYTRALGHALRHEPDVSALVQAGEGLKERLGELFSFGEENDQ